MSEASIFTRRAFEAITWAMVAMVGCSAATAPAPDEDSTRHGAAVEDCAKNPKFYLCEPCGYDNGCVSCLLTEGQSDECKAFCAANPDHAHCQPATTQTLNDGGGGASTVGGVGAEGGKSAGGGEPGTGAAGDSSAGGSGDDADDFSDFSDDSSDSGDDSSDSGDDFSDF